MLIKFRLLCELWPLRNREFAKILACQKSQAAFEYLSLLFNYILSSSLWRVVEITLNSSLLSLLCSYTWLFIKSLVHLIILCDFVYRFNFNCWFNELTLELTFNKERNLKKVAFYLYWRICRRNLDLYKNCLYRVLEWNSAAKRWAERCSDWICIQWPQPIVGIYRCNIYDTISFDCL